MRRALTAAAALLVALVLVAPAGSAGSARSSSSAASAGPTLKSLQAQINVLKKQVKKLQKDVKTAATLGAAAILYTGCSTAVTADALQGTWTTYNGQPAGAPVNDYNYCNDAFSIHRQANTATVAVFQQVIDYFLKQ
jgi:ABC-type proline/glycine betaine transport system substrate-binding protein